MLPPDKEMEGLRTQWEQLSSSISRVAIIRLSILFILVTTFLNNVDPNRRNDIPQGEDPFSGLSSWGIKPPKGTLFPKLSFDFSLLGHSVHINNLSDWLFPLVFALVISQVYLFTLRRKLQTLNTLATQFHTSDGDKTSLLDDLFFSSQARSFTAYASYPSKLADRAYAFCFWALLGLMVVAGSSFWRNWPPWAYVAICVPIITMTFYATAYSFYVSKRLEAETTRLMKARFASSKAMTSGNYWLDRVWEGSIKAFHIVLDRLDPRVPLFIAAVITLVMTYVQWATYKRLIRTLLFAIPATKADYVFNIPETIVSFLTLALAILVILGLIVSPFYPHIWRQRHVNRWLFIVAGAFSIYRISNFGFVNSLPVSESVQKAADLLLSNLSWLIAIGLWYYFAYSISNETRRRWPAIRSFLIVLYAPLAVYIACWYAYLPFWYRHAFHLPILKGSFAILIFVANHLLALGFMKLTGEAEVDGPE